MKVAEFLDREAIVARASAATKRQALQLAADVAARRFGVDAATALDGLIERERAGSTGVGLGVAVPHARVDGLDRLRAVFLRLEQPVAFEAVDDQPVDLVFALFGPPKGDGQHLRALAKAARLLRTTGLREQLRQARSGDAILALLGGADTQASAA
jgi:nitrogen PTS system EIIA component